MAKKINPAISAYSIAVAPSSFLRKKNILVIVVSLHKKVFSLKSMKCFEGALLFKAFNKANKQCPLWKITLKMTR